MCLLIIPPSQVTWSASLCDVFSWLLSLFFPAVCVLYMKQYGSWGINCWVCWPLTSVPHTHTPDVYHCTLHVLQMCTSVSHTRPRCVLLHLTRAPDMCFGISHTPQMCASALHAGPRCILTTRLLWIPSPCFWTANGVFECWEITLSPLGNLKNT